MLNELKENFTIQKDEEGIFMKGEENALCKNEEYELQIDKITIDEKISKEVTQTLVEGEIIVPDIKPDMSVILESKGKITLDKVEIGADRVNFFGKLSVHILYLANTTEKPVHSINVVTQFEDFITIEGITKDMHVDITGVIANLDFNMLNDRKISYKAVVDISAEAFGISEENIISDIKGLSPRQMKKSKISMSRFVDNKEDRFIVKDELKVVSGKPNIGEILETNLEITNKEVKVSNGVVTVSGQIAVTTLYKDDSTGITEFIDNEIQFNGGVDMPLAKDGMFAEVSMQIKEQYVQVKPDNDGEERIVEIEISVGMVAKLLAKEEMEILEDAYCINKKLEIKKIPFTYRDLICRNKNQSPIKEVVAIDDNAQDMLQIFRVTGEMILDEMYDVKVLEDKVVVEGLINADILYVAESDEAPLYSFNAVIPFKQVIETKGSMPSSIVNIESSIEHISFNLLSGKEVEIRFLLCFNTVVCEEKTTNMITEINFCDMEKEEMDKMSSLTIYVVDESDTLFSIAKKYNSQLDEIIEVNNIENENDVLKGQKLLILKNNY